MAELLKSPYSEGNILTLEPGIRRPAGKNVPRQLRDGQAKELKVKVLSVIEPSTMSVVLKVALEQQAEARNEGEEGDEEVETTQVPKMMILKIYDRQFSPQLREFEETGPATSASEEAFTEFVRKGCMEPFLKDIEENGTGDAGDWDVPRREAYFYKMASQSHEIELEIYDRLVDLQGLHVPTIFADVRLAPQHATAEADEGLAKYSQVRGILMEYIEGFPLNEVVTETPESDWAPICDQAIEVVRKISDGDFINFDIKTRNILVRRAESDQRQMQRQGTSFSSPSYQVFFLDFGECKLRDASDSDEVWRERKRQKNEEGAVGYVMTTYIAYAKGKKGKKYKGPDALPWVYTPSSRFEGDYIELYGEEDGGG
ncbi:hypothetical protein E4U21_004325 [Claviceps maximensis]|nr:hypothetical protein E4U21_004325 [Claviceps maximensis]